MSIAIRPARTRWRIQLERRRLRRARRRSQRALRFPRGAKREGKYVEAPLGKFDGQWRL